MEGYKGKLEIIYANNKIKQQCTNIKDAVKLFGGDKQLAVSLLGRINAIEQAEVIKDIIVMPQFHFHNLQGKMKGSFAIDVKGRRDKWRIILCPLNDEGERFVPCYIDQIAEIVKIVEITEVSAHYE